VRLIKIVVDKNYVFRSFPSLPVHDTTWQRWDIITVDFCNKLAMMANHPLDFKKLVVMDQL
jgi:hypothetical protein